MPSDRRCFVQFIHPGGEHWPDQDGMKSWNFDSHHRKFLASRGQYSDASQVQEGEIVFWGEWEAESRVVKRYDERVPDGPHFLYEPFFVEPDQYGDGRQNTDPFVFGDQFHYTGCLQHTSRGETQLRHLTPGSVVLFGSCLQKSRFVIDTVLVVANYIDHSAQDYRDKVTGAVSSTYFRVTVAPWYGNPGETSRQVHRLYFGATYERNVEGMFSFFPCRPHDKALNGFARPEIFIPDFITRNLTQGKKIARLTNGAEAKELWDEVVTQVLKQGLLLGLRAELPHEEPSARSPVRAPPSRGPRRSSAGKCNCR
jgi:hypothetical protein